MDDAIEIESARKLAAGPLGQKLAEFPMLFAKAVFFGRRPKSCQPAEVSNGTVTLANLGGQPLAITCQHVIDGYRSQRNTSRDTMFQIGDVAVDPLEQLIDENAAIDLATLALTDAQLAQITSGGEIGSCVYMPTSWPPEPLTEGAYVAFGGFPGSLRVVEKLDELVFGAWSSGASRVSSVSEIQFVSAFEREAWVMAFGERDAQLKLLGGMSGGPAFVQRGLAWDLVGFVKEYHEAYDAMFFASARSLRPDGTIAPLPV